VYDVVILVAMTVVATTIKALLRYSLQSIYCVERHQIQTTTANNPQHDSNGDDDNTVQDKLQYSAVLQFPLIISFSPHPFTSPTFFLLSLPRFSAAAAEAAGAHRFLIRYKCVRPLPLHDNHWEV